jgi:uncharacterized protein
MERKAIAQLYEWKARSNRKPLIVRGARQVGKTWLIKEFARRAYAKYVYINFEDEENLRTLFDKDFDIGRIIAVIGLVKGIEIDSDTLLIFDEVQEAARGLTALKYFYEKAPAYHIIAAGSLLGISSRCNDSFPVGKVDFVDLYPLSFDEFLLAEGKEKLAEVLRNQDWPMVAMVRDKLVDLLKSYYFVGGMPEVVASFVGQKDFKEVRRLQQNILDSYDRDFSKHAPIEEVPRIRMVWRSIAGQLSKENKKFVYGVLKEGARAREFELAIEWLVDAGLVYKVNRTKRGELPLTAFEDFSAFKLYFLDIGLLGAVNQIQPQTIVAGNELFSTFKGAMTEQYVLQQLKTFGEMLIFYWSAENSRGELDFLIQHKDQVIPVEVKAEENLKSKSLRSFVESNPHLKGIRFSMSDYREQEWMRNYPLYALPFIGL